MLNYALRVNLTIAIVAMVEDPTAATATISNFNLNATTLNTNETTTNLAGLVSDSINGAHATEVSSQQNLISYFSSVLV